MKNTYIPRLFDEILQFSLESKGAVLVVGPKWCGKTTTCARHAKTIVELLPLKTRQQLIEFAKNAPDLFLNQGEKPILIDEWQFIPFIWNEIKIQVDKNSTFGEYILTGSVTNKLSFSNNNEEDTSNEHTGNGRICRKMMRTLSLYESNESNGLVSLSSLKNGNFELGICDKNIFDYAFYICRGGWPLAIGKSEKVALAQAYYYFEILYQDDIFTFKDLGIRKNILTSQKIMRSYARNVGTQCPDSVIINDVNIDLKTFDKYFSALQRLFVVDEVLAWNTNLRRKTAIRTKNTRYFVDPSIAVASLGLTPQSLFKDMKLFGFLFESLAIRDLKIYASTIDASVYHYRDSLNRECDAVIVYRDGEFGLVEIKLGVDDDIEEAANNLKKIRDDLIEKPIYLMVITKEKYAYKREDGVYVVPLGCLKP